MADEGLLIPIQFTLEEARAALAQLENQARQAGQRAGEGAAKGIEGGLAGLKKNMGPARETAMFFTQALGEFGPAGRTAQVAISGVAGAIMGGGGVLAALALAQAGARLLADAWNQNEEAARKAGEEAKKAADEIAAKIKEARERLQQEVFKLSETSAAEVYRQTTLAPALEAVKAAEAEALGSAQRVAAAKRAGDLEEYSAWKARYDRAMANLEPLRKVAKDYERTWATILGQEELGRSDKASKDARDATKAAADARKALEEEFRQEILAGEDEYRAKRNALILQAEVSGLDERQKAEVEYQRTLAGLKEGDTQAEAAALTIRNAKIAAIDKAEYDERLALVAEFRAEIVAGEEELRAKQEAIQRQYADFMRGSMMDLASSALGAFRPILTQSAAYNRAMKEAGGATKASADLSAAAFAAMTQDFLANLALQAASKAIFEVAEGYAALANPLTAALAPMHFTAATNYGIVAGVVAVGAATIGATRGMTAAERASVADAAGQLKIIIPFFTKAKTDIALMK